MKENVTVEEKRKMAVAFLIRNEGEQPEGTQAIFAKLMGHERDAAAINQQMEQARRALDELAIQLDKKIGSIEGIADVITDMLPEDKLDEWAEGYESIMQQQAAPAPQAPKPEVEAEQEAETSSEE